MKEQGPSAANTLLRLFQLVLFLYLFLFSIDLMGTALKLFGKGFAETLIARTSHPMVGLFIGMLATAIIQSSSSTTSIVVGMVGGGVLTVHNAIPIVMGANIGTTVTNILVSLAHINRSHEFRRSFAASTVHDFFNVLSVICIFPLQYFTNFLGISSTFLGKAFENIGGFKLFNPIKAITKPVVNVLVDFAGQYPWVLLAVSLILLFVALANLVRTLRVVVVKRAEEWFNRVLFKTTLRAFVVGLLLTALAQSSSITTSLVVPLAGAGILRLEQIFPYTLGANIGTTVTAMLAALITSNANAITVAFAHLLFNISGTVIWLPLKQIPIAIAQKFSDFSIRNKIIPIGYIIVAFFIIPITVILIFS